MPYNVIAVCLLSQSAPENHIQEEKPTNLCAPREFPPKNVSAMFDDHVILLF